MDNPLEELLNTPPPALDEMRDDRNLAEEISRKPDGAERLVKIGDDCKERYLIDKKSRQGWEDDRARYLDQFLCKWQPTDFPWTDAAAMHVPFLTEGCANFGARFYEAQMPAKGPVTVKAMGSEDEPRSTRLIKHLNYQMQFESSLPEALDTASVQLPLDGSVFMEIDWDFDKEQHRIETIPAHDLVVNFRYRGPLEDASRISKICRKTEIQLKRMAKDGFILDLPSVFEAVSESAEGDNGSLLQKSTDVEGTDKPADDPTGTRSIIQMHTEYDIWNDGDPIACIVTFDLLTGTVLRIESREYTDTNGKRRAFCHFVELIFIPNPSSGAYGIGFGQLMRSIIETADQAINHLINAGELATTTMGMVNDRSGLLKGDFAGRPGEFKAVQSTSERLADDIFQFQFAQPNGSLLSLLGMMAEYSQRITSVGDLQRGVAPRGSNTTATEILSLTEQGLKMFSAVHKRARRSLEMLFRKASLLNHMYLSDEKYVNVLGTDWEEYRTWQQQMTEYQQAQTALEQIIQQGFAPPGLVESVLPTLSNPPPATWASVAEDYAPGVDVVPAADPEIVSRTEKLALAEKTMQVVMSVPSAAQDQQAIWEAGKRILAAMGTEDIDRVLPPPQPPPPPPPPTPQEEELAGLLEGKPMNVHEMDDSRQHMLVIANFKESEYYNLLTADQKANLDQHERSHAAALYRKETAQNGQAPSPEVPTPGGPPPGAYDGGGATMARAVDNALSPPVAGSGEAIDNAPPSLLGRFGDQLRSLAGTE